MPAGGYVESWLRTFRGRVNDPCFFSDKNCSRTGSDSSAGVRRSDKKTCRWLSTTRASWFCPGSNAKGWLQKSCPLPLGSYPMTGSAAMVSDQYCWKPSWNTNAIRALASRQPNWIHVGPTTGRRKKSTSHNVLIPAQDIWLYPLRKNFAAALCQ